MYGFALLVEKIINNYKNAFILYYIYYIKSQFVTVSLAQMKDEW